jgi:hypothetical protein
MDPFLSIDPFYNPTLIFQFESIIKNKDMNYLLLIKKLLDQRLKELNNGSLLLKKKTIIK